MPNTIRAIQNTLNSGEISPRLKGRMDSPRYHNGLEQCTNALPMILGGATRRPGSVYAGTAVAAAVLLLPFKYATTTLTGIALAFTAGVVRFYADSQPVLVAGVPYELATPYSAAEIPELNFEQFKNELHLLHPAHQPQRLTCSGVDSWKIEALPIVNWPYLRPPDTSTIALTPSTISGIATVTASADLFQPGHVGSRFKINGGIFRVETVTSPTVVTGIFDQAIHVVNGVVQYMNEFTVTVDPALLTGNAAISLKAYSQKTVTTYRDLASDVYFDPTTNPTGIVSTVVHTTNLVGKFEEATDTINLAITKANMTGPATMKVTVRVRREIITADPGSFAGWIVVVDNSVTPTTLPAGITVAIAGYSQNMTGMETDYIWTEQAWSNLRGWPRAVTFHDQRALLAGTATFPNTIWMSRIANFLDYAEGALADDPTVLALASSPTPIVHLRATDRVYIFTLDREMTIDTGNAPLTPTNLQIRLRTTYGCCYHPPPALTSGQILFFGPSRITARTLSYRFDIDGFVAPDLALLAEHLLRDGIVDCCFAREPYSTFWAVTSTGNLISCTYDREQEVTAWASHQLGGAGLAISCTAVPDAKGRDQVYLAINRGGTVTIEYLDPEVMLDGTIRSTPVGEAWSGLGVYEGKTLTAVIDGVVVPDLTVAGGAVTIPFSGSQGVIGYPYTTTIKDTPLDLTSQGVTQLGAIIGMNRIRVRFDRTSDATVNGQPVPFRQFGGGLLDQAAPLFTGDQIVEHFGRSTEPDATQVTIIQEQPLPLTVLAIVKEVTVNG